MVGHLMWHGLKINLLPSPQPPEKSTPCPFCDIRFDTTGVHQRTQVDICGHEMCMECMVTKVSSEKGCEECARENLLESQNDSEALEFGMIWELIDLVDEEDDMNTEEEGPQILEPEVTDQEAVDNGNDIELIELTDDEEINTTEEKAPIDINGDDDKDPENNPSTSSSISLRLSLRKSKQKPKGSSKKMWVCCHCPGRQVSFPSKTQLGLHLNQNHSSLRPYPCDICGFPFDTPKNLTAHKLTHTNERPFKFPLCQFGFNQYSTLKKHADKMHGVTLPRRRRSRKEKGYQADKFEVQTENRKRSRSPESISEMLTKKRCYTRTKPRFHCSHCDRTFNRKYKLGEHLNLKHADLRPYSCNICGWRFVQAYKLQLHQITHTIDRPFKCVQCRGSFSRKYSLERHMRIYHLRQPRDCEDAKNKPNPFECPLRCEARFERKFSLERHLANVHGIRMELEKPGVEEYCHECQSKVDDETCVKVVYVGCGHPSCLDCVTKAGELGCGQCTTEEKTAEDEQPEVAEMISRPCAFVEGITKKIRPNPKNAKITGKGIPVKFAAGLFPP